MNENGKKMLIKVAERLKPRRLVLFGSMASGTAGPDSDMDVCVIQDEVKDKIGECVRIREMLGRDVLPMDLLVFSSKEFDKRKDIWGTVQYEIDKNGIVLYERRN